VRVELDYHGITQRGVRHAIAQHHPPRHPPALPLPGIRDVDRFVRGVTGAVSLLQDRDSSHACIVARNSVVPAGGVFMISQSEKEYGAYRNPQWVEQPEVPPHARYHSRAMTRDEIQQKLIEIVRQEKDIPDDKLTPETVLVEAGVDSLDALTILFAIEETFHISIPDDKARAIKTFGDMVTIVEELMG
jgi:acyl carrier protein